MNKIYKTQKDMIESNNEINDFINDIRKAMHRETALSRSKEEKPPTSDILLAAREMMKRVKDKNDRSNQNNR